jgi:flagellin-like hook-associated protein FlgL
VDISATTTVGGVINAINTQLAAGGINSVTASVSPTGNGLRLTAAQTGTITTQTPLSNLNNGAGLDMVPGKFRVSTDDGSTNVLIDVSTATDVGDLYTLFNLQLAAAGVTNVSMSIDPGQTGLRIVDNNVPPLGLKITDETSEYTAHDLGILGYVDSQLDGSALNPEPGIIVAESAPGENTATNLGIVGSFNGILDGTDLDPILKLTTPLSALDGGRGLTLGRLRIQQGDRTAIVDLTTATTVNDVVTRINNSGLSIQASINPSQRGLQVVSTVDDRSLMITEQDASGTAGKLGIMGSPDLFGNMMLLVDGLQRNDRAAVATLIGTLEAAANKALESRSAVGANINRLSRTSDRLSDFELSMTRLLSEVEDADIIKVTTELATQQNIYQAALNAAARVLQPSLVDFIR